MKAEHTPASSHFSGQFANSGFILYRMSSNIHFTIQELTFSSTATRLRIDNTPPAAVLKNMNVLLTGLERIRAMLGAPMHIDSGYRCPALNAAVKGAANSAHVLGYAADFVCPGFGTPLEIVARLKISDLVFDQCIQEGTWVHISFDPKARREMLTAHFGPGGTTYTRDA